MSQVKLIEGVVQHYAWGGKDYLADWLGQEHKTGSRLAELWLGAHPKGPARLIQEDRTLDEWIAEQPRQLLGDAVAERYHDRLPFLLKILDVKNMLSIQVHPTKAAAEIGFAREQRSGLPLTAPNRNYRDDNHKPELGIALTDFYLLHGFQSAAAIRASLLKFPEWNPLLAILDRAGVAELYRTVMSASQQAIDTWLAPVVRRVQSSTKIYHRKDPEFWVLRAAEQYGANGHQDRGIFSIFWFNIVHLHPGEGIFQDAGVPHAYLEGACVEIMANSDNVLRGGLTPKHIDVPELLKHTICSAVQPRVLVPVDRGGGWQRYATPAPDFSLSVARLTKGKRAAVALPDGPAILLLRSGTIIATDSSLMLNEDQRAAFLPAGSQLSFTAETDAELFLAEVGP